MAVNMITIQNLTHKQKMIMSVLWELDTMEKVKAFIASLPLQDARDAQALLEIAVQETLEQEPGRMALYADYAQAVIRSASGR
jgi:hypothetical protein